MIRNNQQRVDNEFEKQMRDIMKARYEKGLAKFSPKELGMAEATRLLTRTPSWTKVTQELKSLPKKENLI